MTTIAICAIFKDADGLGGFLVRAKILILPCALRGQYRPPGGEPTSISVQAFPLRNRECQVRLVRLRPFSRHPCVRGFVTKPAAAGSGGQAHARDDIEAREIRWYDLNAPEH
jgi:hypothetical protein